MFGWVVLYLTQTTLVANGNIALHRRLGWLSVGWIPAVFLISLAMTVTSLKRTGGPPFFDSNEFLFTNAFQLVAFAALGGAAIVMRRRTAWHRRLLVCAMTILAGPGIGRLLPSPFLVPWVYPILVGVALLFPAAGILSDLRRRGRIHPSWWWGCGLIIGSLVLGEALGHTQWAIDVTQNLLAGQPGEARGLIAPMR